MSMLLQAAANFVGYSRKKSFDLLTIEIIEKHREYLKSVGSTNVELEKMIESQQDAYNKILKKL